MCGRNRETDRQKHTHTHRRNAERSSQDKDLASLGLQTPWLCQTYYSATKKFLKVNQSNNKIIVSFQYKQNIKRNKFWK